MFRARSRSMRIESPCLPFRQGEKSNLVSISFCFESYAWSRTNFHREGQKPDQTSHWQQKEDWYSIGLLIQRNLRPCWWCWSVFLSGSWWHLDQFREEVGRQKFCVHHTHTHTQHNTQICKYVLNGSLTIQNCQAKKRGKFCLERDQSALVKKGSTMEHL